MPLSSMIIIFTRSTPLQHPINLVQRVLVVPKVVLSNVISLMYVLWLLSQAIEDRVFLILPAVLCSSKGLLVSKCFVCVVSSSFNWEYPAIKMKQMQAQEIVANIPSCHHMSHYSTASLKKPAAATIHHCMCKKYVGVDQTME